LGFVLDSSVTLAWLLPDEEGERVDALADRLELESAEVPAIWSLEVGNALISALRRARIDDAVIASSLRALATLPINPDRAMGASELSAIVAIASQHGLTTYDACYVELAQRRHLPLATLDRKLREACDAMGVAVLP
jgi:predicted nucleic acid-binding protein